MAEKKETAEQKLLKIIETQEGQKPEAQAKPAASDAALQVAAAVKNTGLPPISVSSILSPLTALLRGHPSAAGAGAAFGPREINKILVVVSVVMALFFSNSLISGMRLLRQKVSFSYESGLTQNERDFSAAYKALSEYLSSIQTRNIFQPFEKKEVVEEEFPEETKRIATLAKNFKLVGISWLDSPETASAMIEDTVSGVTHFLREGEKINDVVIKTIYADRIIISYEGEDLTIRL